MPIIMPISHPMEFTFDPAARKKATNGTINSDLLALAEKLRQRRSAEWLKENRGAIEGYNADVGARGVFSDGLRNF